MAIKGSNDIFIPKNPVNVSFRPLNKGVRRDIAGEAISEGEFYDVTNAGVGTRGPTKRGAFEVYSGGVEINSTSAPILDMGVVWKSSGTQYGCLITNKYLYLMGRSNLTPIYWPYSAGVVKSIMGTNVQFSKSIARGSTMFTTPTSYLTGGDIFVLSNTGKAIRITAFNTKSDATIGSTIGSYPSVAGGRTYHIRRAFNVASNTLFDWIPIDQKLVITDKKRKGMYAYNGATLGVYSAVLASQGYVPAAVCHFKERIWSLNSQEGIFNDKRHRIRWSSVTGDPRTWAASDYLDLAYTPGQGRRLIPLGNLLIAYFEDAIYYGVPSNIPDLPLKWDKIETGGIGLVGPRAITSHLGGHFFVGQDNIYFMGGDPRSGPIPIGTQIAEDTILACADPRRVYVVTDPKRQRILVGFPMVSPGTMDEIWAYDYIARAWSKLDYEATMLANPLIQLGFTWSDLSGTWTALGSSYASWDAMPSGTESARDVFVGNDLQLHRLGEGTTDVAGGAVPVRLETGDLDLGVPDDDKTFTRFTLKLRDRPAASVSFLTSGSEDGGNTWRQLGTLNIAADKREGAVDFGITGSAVRFRLSSASIVAPYTVSEFTVRVRPRGRETTSD